MDNNIIKINLVETASRLATNVMNSTNYAKDSIEYITQYDSIYKYYYEELTKLEVVEV